ncbi:hypothetical protein HMPREF1544_01583 [Mucor circinelloides 1006PhL]|uniref:G-patch domain-containing protein n=1 Tax=Mucor circinelloides f. circinelloides (strain 1006PhL) TaxID=1220926 RepID=S2JMS7_MUCC1|nr:hypothetical protein HMPREF1544_01583 [Mucor circinelloides 1006PhL]
MSKGGNAATENFVVFGTAFPETTEKDRRAGRTDAGQFVPTWKQEARDEQGRRRFHGAFTGGFSAGYFNTVGSKEGWTPTNYVSSRNARNERKEARPEDYMDEEDLEAMAGARKLVATEEFDILGGTERELAARRKQQQEEEARGSGLDFLGSSLINMFGPPKDSVGVRLLRKMGWRPGQGIGPRVKRRMDDEDQDDDDEALSNITFAPRDTPIENFQAKRDTYGLGFDLSTSVPEVAEMKRLRELARQKEMSGQEVDKKNRSSFGILDTSGRKVEAFGLGALEDDDDEDDVYRTDTANYHTSLYDDEGGLTRDQVKIQSMKRKREQMEEAEKSKHSLKCSDGRPPLKGFHVSDKPQHIGKWHAPPKVPAEFTGQHVVKEDQDSQTDAPKISKESLFSFEERGNALGEKPIEQRSVFDYMPKHSKDKLDQAVSYFIDIGKDKSQLSEFPVIPKDVAKLALQGFMPFGDNLKKQARYRSYLENQAGMLTEDGEPKTVLPIPEGLTYESGMKEMDEFAKAARIFRPISAMMSGRFTSASETSKNIEVVNFEGGLKTEEQYRKEKEQRIKEQPKPEKKQLTQEAEAAAMKMFGNLTRTVKPFYPNRLVCKRFNVKDPHPNHDHTADKAAGRTQGGNKDALSKESMETILNERLPLGQKFTSVSEMTESLAQPDDDPMMKAVVPKPSQRNQNFIAPTTGIDTTKKQDTEEDEGPPLDYERPSMDIFKAIFNDSDSEEEEEDKVEEAEHRENTVVASSATLDQDDFIGPPMPPQPATADIPLTTTTAATTTTTSLLPKDEPFRPMFKRASERKDQSASSLLPQVISEQVVVQPFKPRSSRQKRRQVDVSDDEKEEQKERDGYKKQRHSRSRSRSPSASPDRSRRDRKSSKKSRRSKSKRDRSRSRSRDDDRSSSKRHGDSKKRKSDKESHRSSRHRHHHQHKSSRHKHREQEDQDDLEAFWVEKETSNVLQKSDKPVNGGRMSAANMW